MDRSLDANAGGITRRAALASVTATSVLGLAGCLGGEPREDGDVADEFVFAATVRDDPDDVARDWEPLADRVTESTDVPTRVDPVQDDGAAISALATGQAHAAYLSGGPAWVGWQRHGLEPLAVEVDEAGDTHYVAAAWARTDGEIETVADLEGVDSCHTGDLTGAGMLVPTAHLSHEGLVSFDAGDDVTAIRNAVEAFFGDPVVGGGYVGALQCLSNGRGDVAFVRKHTPADYCGDDPESWCLALADYRLLEEFAEVPSHPIMASPEATETEIELLADALLALDDDPEGRAILEDTLGVHGLEPATSREHLGDYGQLIEILPGIEDHLVE